MVCGWSARSAAEVLDFGGEVERLVVVEICGVEEGMGGGGWDGGRGEDGKGERGNGQRC